MFNFWGADYKCGTGSFFPQKKMDISIKYENQ